MITVKALIEHLQKLPPDMEVWADNDDYVACWPYEGTPAVAMVTRPTMYEAITGKNLGEWPKDGYKEVCRL